MAKNLKQNKNDRLKKGEDTKKFNVVLISAAAVIVAALIIVSVIAIVNAVKDKNAAPGELVAIESEHYKITNAMISYYLDSDLYSSLSTYYYTYAMNGLDLSKSLKNQEYNAQGTSSTQSMTWFDYFLNNTVGGIMNYTLFAEKAYDLGLALDDNDKALVEKTITAIKDAAEEGGYNYEEYIEYLYGTGVTEADVREAAEFITLAKKQYSNDEKSFTYSDDKLQETYLADTQKYDVVDYRTYVINAANAGDADLEKVASDLIDKSETEADFVQNVRDYMVSINDSLETPLTDEQIDDQIENTLMERVAYSESSEFLPWAFDDAREEGDTTFLKDESGNYIVYYLISTPYRLDYTTKNVRHILINSSKYDSDDEAKAKADEVFALWNKGEKTEEAFEKLGAEYNDDSSNLYENVKRDQMVDEFEDWCYDESRKPGDCEIVKSSYGYHIIYFVGDGEPAWKVDVTSELRTADMQTLTQQYTESYKVEFNRENLYRLSGHTMYSKTAPASTKTATDDTAN